MKLVHKLRDMSESTPLIDSGTEAYFLIYLSQLHLDTPYPLVVPKQPVIRQVYMYYVANCVFVKFMITDDYVHNPATSCCDPPLMHNHCLCQYVHWPSNRRLPSGF